MKKGLLIVRCPLINKDTLVLTARESGKMFCRASYLEGYKDTRKGYVKLDDVIEILKKRTPHDCERNYGCREKVKALEGK